MMRHQISRCVCAVAAGLDHQWLLSSRSAIGASHHLNAVNKKWTITRAYVSGRDENAKRDTQCPTSPSCPSNQPIQFPCLDALDEKSASLFTKSRRARPTSTASSGPEPSYNTGHHEVFHCKTPLLLDWGGVLPSYHVAYETWGTLNSDKSNAILLHTGLSASSHAHSTPTNPQPGWWERFIGPDAPLDTNKYFIICTNILGGCFGSTGPSSIDPSTGTPYAVRFPILTIEDMVRAQFSLVDHMGIRKLYACVGSSMGGMQSLAAGVLFPDRIYKIVSISACARSHPYSIAMRHTQRQALLMDPNWARGMYYGPDHIPPHMGMKLAREVATVTYRSGPEWEKRFGRKRVDPSKQPALCADYLIETYLDHAGEKWSLTYDPNSFLYVSKAMDLFDLGQQNQRRTSARRQELAASLREKNELGASLQTHEASLSLPSEPYEEKEDNGPEWQEQQLLDGTSAVKCPVDLVRGLSPLKEHPTLIMGIASDLLFPAGQQREVASSLRLAGNQSVIHQELGEDVSLFGHDTFLLDVNNIGGPVKQFL